MAKNKNTTDDLQTVAATQMAEVPIEMLEERVDHGDAAQRAEMDALNDLALDEPTEMVDAPARPREPLTRNQKRRNLRR